jgi:hypothetical protein
MKYLLSILLFIAAFPLASQVESYDEMNIEADSIRSNYKPAARNYVMIRSKRGNSGVNRSPKADSVAALPINEVVLVFTETTPEDLAEREEANRERWENLLNTYPEYFAENVTFKNVCQCNRNGDEAALKQTQGFYIYYTAPEPPPQPVKQAAKARQEEAPAAPVKEEKKPEKTEKVVTRTEEPETRSEKTAEKVAEKKAEAPHKEAAREEPPAVTDSDDENTPVAEPVKPRPKKTGAVAKARKARDPKACRPPCYEGGDEDLNNFFVQNITLSKKQRRKGKHMIAQVRIQLNNDGSVKKTMVTGEIEALNKQVEDALKAMNNWNSAVKNGTAIKSEVKITLKYDRESRGLKPFEIVTVPRLPAKCRCVSDSELFD